MTMEQQNELKTYVYSMYRRDCAGCVCLCVCVRRYHVVAAYFILGVGTLTCLLRH